MLDQSSAELRATIEDLEKHYDTIDNEGNEWKTRFETQTEMNQQLEKQILMLQEKVEEAKRNLKEAGKSPRDNRAFDDLADASPHMVKTLERERNSLFNQLRDLEWRLDQESKVRKQNKKSRLLVLHLPAHLHKQLEVSFATTADVGITGGTSKDYSKSWRQQSKNIQRWRRSNTCSLDIKIGGTITTDRKMGKGEQLAFKPVGYWEEEFQLNIPEDQRIIDARYGPIRKTAAVKVLPSLDSN
uniref:Uncharacterized protein n=1 Tax=Biomphalaria glabrata TaxID=6526 RepID=A0A2C9KRX4_BIOGL